MRWLRSKYHAFSSLRAPQPYPPSTYKDTTTTRIPSMSSISSLPRNCSLATPKHNYVHYDTSALSPPAHLNPTLWLTCPTCGHSTCSKQNTTRIILTPSDIPCLTASLRPSLSPVVRLRCTLGPTSRPHKLYRVGASLSHSQQLKYSHWSIATPLRDIQTCICLRISRVSCAWAE
ncbi:hypothetical protein F5888DRAFT_265459 [Russula emetica]|nr:hypothetical protein F5888DRAFT_265459 [Russula emetica]